MDIGGASSFLCQILWLCTDPDIARGIEIPVIAEYSPLAGIVLG